MKSKQDDPPPNSDFSPDIYRRYNLDLRELSDAQLAEHFRSSAHEPRIYAQTSSAVEALSMRWLRGAGIEIGAGGSPTPLYGNATVSKIDNDDTRFYGGGAADIHWNIDEPDFAKNNRGRFDFAVASHVLEHADSFIRAVENMMLLTRTGGIVYIILPDINFMRDKEWMSNFDFEHHKAEYANPLAHADLHDRQFIEGNVMLYPDEYATTFSGVYDDMVASRKVPPELRFLQHKHDYCFNDWLGLFIKTQDFLAQRFRVVDARYGHERADCHFVLQVT